MLDGEACVLDELGRSDFNRLQDRARRRRWVEGMDAVMFCAFDLLAQDGKPLIDKPVEWRKAQLAKLLAQGIPSVMYAGHFSADQEGLVAKRLGSPYQPGVRSPDWQNVKRKSAVPPERFKR